jgi:hypothetical protein
MTNTLMIRGCKEDRRASIAGLLHFSETAWMREQLFPRHPQHEKRSARCCIGPQNKAMSAPD